MKVQFGDRMIEIHDLIALLLATNYLQYGFADDGEADLVAKNLLDVLDQLGCEIVKKTKE